MHYLVGKNRKQMRRYLPDKKRLVLLGKLAYEEVLDGGCHDLQNPYLKSSIGFDRLKPKEILLNYKRFIIDHSCSF